MASLTLHPERELPNPFAEGDEMRNQLQWCIDKIYEQQEQIKLLLEISTMLMRKHNV